MSTTQADNTAELLESLGFADEAAVVDRVAARLKFPQRRARRAEEQREALRDELRQSEDVPRVVDDLREARDDVVEDGDELPPIGPVAPVDPVRKEDVTEPNVVTPGGLSGGIGDDADAREFDPRQIRRGIEVEMEHTDDPEIALEIVVDHLTEDPRYYDKLAAVEPVRINSKPRVFVEGDDISDELREIAGALYDRGEQQYGDELMAMLGTPPTSSSPLR